MVNDVAVVFLIAHFLGDYHFQSQEMADEKRHSLKALAKHMGVHAFFTLFWSVIMFGGWDQEIGMAAVGIWITHALIDLLKYFASNNDVRSSEEELYVVDQLLHLLMIYMFTLYLVPPEQIVGSELLRWVLLVLAITKPANVTFKVVFQRFQFETNTETVPGAGAVIGNLERVLSAVFLAMGSVTAIGFIYTAKSIARFKEIEDNKPFAEYYLIGTLFSILYVLVAYYFVFGI